MISLCIRWIIIVIAASMSGLAYAEPITRNVNAEVIVGYDFMVVQQNAGQITFKYSDPENFTTRVNNPAKFNFSIETTRDTLDQCSLEFITWMKRRRINNGLAVSNTKEFRPGFSGVLSSDKTVLSGDDNFTAAHSAVVSDFFGPNNGEPLSQIQWEEILATRQTPRIMVNFPALDDYPYQDFFDRVPEGQSIAWMSPQTAWEDDRYVVFSLPCESLITLPIIDVSPPVDKTAPSVSFSPPSLTVRSGKTGTSRLTATDIGGSITRSVTKCTNGGNFSGSTFTSPSAAAEVTSICTAAAIDAAGNAGSGTLIVKVLPPAIWPSWIIPAVIALLFLGVGMLLWLRRSHNTGNTKPARLAEPPIKLIRPSKPLERPDNAGVIFPASPMQAANVATPLSPAGQLTASKLQMLTGQYAALRPAYHATGRIGYAQEGKPTSKDYSFGTGFLITPNHVMTNRHVHGFYGHYLTCSEDCGGIEFIAEKDKDASDFIPFNGQPPLLLSGLDIAIYTLSRSAENRTPISRVPIPTEDLEGREIAVVGYPDTHDPNNPDILAIVEDNPIFAVKRISQGQIFRHSTDNDDPYGVQVDVNEDDETKFPMTAICHNASTLGGNSGSPILDIKTGELLGVHFAGHKIFNQKEAANLAMAIAQLTEHSDIKNV